MRNAPRLVASLALALLSALAACGSPSPSDGGEPDDMAGPSAPPPYAGELTLPVKTQLSWQGSPGEGSIEAAQFADGRGTLTFEGAVLPAVVYKKIPFGEFTLAAILATTPDNVLVAYAYCKDGGVTAFYFESLRYTVTAQTALSNAGSCAFVDEPSSGQVSFIRPTGPLAYAAPDDHADVDGARVTVHGGTGSLRYGSDVYDLSVFTTVDCDATRCGGVGWYELHSTLRRGDELAMAILYLAPDKPGVVQVGYGFRFDRPALWPPDELLDASWTTK